MADEKYFPGPWKVESGKEWKILAANGQIVLLIGNERCLIPTRELQRLIVSAPRLLAVCRATMAHLQSDSDTFADREDITDQLEKEIRKASHD